MTTAREMIDRLHLRPHPEGGHYRETVRLPASAGERSPMTAILFLLSAGERSHWHRVDAAELWLWHAGAPVWLAIDRAAPVLLGGDVTAGQLPQVLVPAAAWQSAQAHAGWALVSCVVAPGFDFAGFTLAAPDWRP